MDIGVPKEIKDQEFRVGLSPANVQILCQQGHRLFVETGAGLGAGFTDRDYEQGGAQLLSTAAAVWQQELVIKVKEPLPSEYDLLQAGQILFTYLHLAANRPLTEQVDAGGGQCDCLRTVEVTQCDRVLLPLLTPMSVIAGRLSIQFGAHFLERQQGGRGVLLGGIPGVRSGKVVILGGGVVGTEAARIALGMGAEVTILDINLERLAYLENLFGSQVELLYSNAEHLLGVLPRTDLLVGAVLVPGKRAPILVSRQGVQKMQPGTVIVDVAVDQGGCIETLRTTSHTDPVYVEEGVLHYGVPNMPGAVPWTATQALNHSTFPYIAKLANQGLAALEQDSALQKGLNIHDHRLVHPAVQQVFPDLQG
ncbi:MAG: alanine dehydrogenase [Acaryochloridaceae cyanobacterium CSU_5_19]|nr:alanine dehydrogenase [Acaryochloridaceae cyanobacterium CSU_5_19]